MASPTRLPSLRRPAGSSRPVSLIENPMANIPNLDAFPSDPEQSKKMKRRSLLPQFSRKGSVAEEDQASSRESNSIDGDGSRPSSDARQSIESSGRRGIDEDRRAMPPPATKAARPMSMIPPRGSSQASKLPGVRPHARNESQGETVDPDAARAQSLAALTGTPSTTDAPKSTGIGAGVKRSGSTRLPQSPRVDGPMIPSRTTSAQTRSARTKTSPKQTRDKRPPTASGATDEDTTVSKLRLPVISALASSEPSTEVVSTGTATRTSTASRIRPGSQAVPPTSPPRVSSKARPVSQIVPPSSKPAFTTYQQHYSPAKSALPKPPLPSAKHSQKPSLTIETDDLATFETTKQQIELLQLSLLHQSAGKCLNDYTASAKRKLGKIHNRLRKDYEELRAVELIHQRAFNLTALDTWCPDTALLVENLQILSLVYSDLSTLMEEGSRHSDVVAMFELWMNEAESAESGDFIQPLPEDWRSSHGSLLLKLRTTQRNLRILPPMHAEGETSGAGLLLRACKALVEDMLKELEVMVKLEKVVMAREKSKVEDEVGLMMTGTNVNETAAWKPAWQSVQ